MSLTLFLSCLLYVFGPLLAIFWVFVSKKAQNVILSMGSSFAWTIAILLTSTIWMIVKPLREVFPFILPFAVVFQEAARYGIWKLYYVAYHQSEMFREDPSKPTDLAAAVSIGWGIGGSMALIMQAPSLFSALGPADLPAPGCPSVSAFHMQALMTLPTALLHILITIIVFDAYPRKSWLLIGLSAFLHFLAAFASLTTSKFNCFFGVGLVWSALALGVVVTWRSLVSPMSTLVRRTI